MSVTDVFELAGAVIVSLGGGSLLILALSNWLGKIWANRIMEKDRAKHVKELEELRAKLTLQNQKTIDSLKSDLEIYQEKHLRGYKDKIEIYRVTTDIICDLLADLDLQQLSTEPLQNGLLRYDRFNRSRMKAYGYLAMLAPQSVMDAYDNLADHLLSVVDGKEKHDWPKMRELATVLINEVRKDIGIDPSPIEYRGKR